MEAYIKALPTKHDFEAYVQRLERSYKQEITELRKDIQQLMYHQDDQENRARRNNIRIRGLPESVETTDLAPAVIAIFNNLLHKDKDAPLELDRVHRALGPKNPNLEHPRDFICRLHFYAIKDTIMKAARVQDAIYFNETPVSLLPDVSKLTLDMRRALKPLTSALQEKQIKCRWGFQYNLFASHEGNVDLEEYRSMIVMMFTIKEINNNPDLLPNVTLGYRIFSTCDDPLKTLGYAIKILSGEKEAPNYYCKGDGEVAAFIGDSSLPTNHALAQFLSLYRYTQLHKYMRNVHYNDPDDGEIYFNERQEIPTELALQSWMALNNSRFITMIPVSRCSDSCIPGNRKKFGSSVHKCCYECVSCPEGEISNISDSENCIKCPDEEWPNEKKDRCVPKLVEFLSYTDTIVAVFSAVSILCCLLTGLILRIFIHYQDTPNVKANNRNLSYLLLVSIMLSFLCVFLFLGHPVDVTCMLRVTSFGVIFSVAVSSLLAKSMMVCIAFKATKPGSLWKKWMGAKLPNFIICVFSLVQVIICVTWLSISPPFQDQDTHTYQGKIIIQCNEGSVIGFYSVLGYMGLLAAVSFIIAFLARTLPDSFNEAKYITFSMLVFCSVWIAMIPAYQSTRGKYMVAVEVFALTASSSGLLGCIFFPKCYIILFRPDLNTKTFIH
ncbi:vomeronasal type-2 receptor 116-like [Aquarana catesbeiana]|uniref:vomeronasal type-2 receptor 116-like n=1 Tax=Aquarana catesbeiana TaxID=8400 RepID=UPI003CC9E7AE